MICRIAASSELVKEFSREYSSRNLAALADLLPTVSGAGSITGRMPFLIEKVHVNLRSVASEMTNIDRGFI